MNQKLLAVIGDARVYGKEFIGTLEGSFWGTKFSMTDWGLKQAYNAALGISTFNEFEKCIYTRLFRRYEVHRLLKETKVCGGGGDGAGEPSESVCTSESPGLFDLNDMTPLSQPGDCTGHSPTRRNDYTQDYEQRCLSRSVGSGGHGTMLTPADGERNRNVLSSNREDTVDAIRKQTPVKYWELPYSDQAGGVVGEPSQHSLGTEGFSSLRGQAVVPCAGRQKKGRKSVLFCSGGRSPATGVQPKEGEIVEATFARRRDMRVARTVKPSENSGPGEAEPITVLPHSQEEELCCIYFERNLRGDMPRQMRVRLNRHGESHKTAEGSLSRGAVGRRKTEVLSG